MERVVIDTDILLDFLLKRKPFLENAEKIFKAIYEKKVDGIIASTTIMNAGYVIERLSGTRNGWDNLYKIIQIVKIQPIDGSIIINSINSEFDDKEDGVVYYSALEAKADRILTRNLNDFKFSKIPVMSSI